jgi:isoquinoline 1-oxidoreductase alpha subunit
VAAIRFQVNGRQETVDADPRTPLLWVLRDNLNLTGTKYGCGWGLCGSCTVHIDGMALRACQIPLSYAAGKRVTTIEGLSPDSSHPLQKAWIEEDAPQCGYCQPGQIMTAAAFLAKNPKPTDDEIATAMNANICRCGTYARIQRAVKRAAQGGA